MEHLSRIVRAVYLEQLGGYPRAEAFFVAAPTGVRDKQRPGFEGFWTQVTGRRERAVQAKTLTQRPIIS